MIPRRSPNDLSSQLKHRAIFTHSLLPLRASRDLKNLFRNGRPPRVDFLARSIGRESARVLAHHSRPRSLGTDNVRARAAAAAARHASRSAANEIAITCFPMRFDVASIHLATTDAVGAQISKLAFDTPGLARESICCSRCSIGALRRQPTPSKVAQLASMERTPVGLPRISAGVSKSTKYGDGCFLPSSPTRGREIALLFPLAGPPAEILARRGADAEGTGPVGAVRQPQPPPLRTCGVRRVREDWFHERLPRARPARLLRGR